MRTPSSLGVFERRQSMRDLPPQQQPQQQGQGEQQQQGEGLQWTESRKLLEAAIAIQQMQPMPVSVRLPAECANVVGMTVAVAVKEAPCTCAPILCLPSINGASIHSCQPATKAACAPVVLSCSGYPRTP